MTKSRFNPIAKLATASALASLTLLAGQPAFAEEDAKPAETEMSEGEKRLAELLEGRVAGEPVNCIRSLLNDRLTVIDETAYVYGRGRTIYVQRTQNPEQIDRRETLVSRRFNGNQVCRQDVITTIDPVLGFFTGAVFFTEFVPYTRIDKDEG